MDDIKKFENFILNKYSDDKKSKEEWSSLKEEGYLPYIKTNKGFEIVDIDNYKTDGDYHILKISKVDELNKAREDYISARKNYTNIMKSAKK
tara:strand:- start:374 stop:649 length:276 start_codon:yes stop_codon:yes gene_type:complete